jgi:signal transduction histidine kinase
MSVIALRATVKLLRSPAAGAERGTVGLSGLGRLADNAREAGLAVDLDVDVSERCLDEAIGAAAYRIVQESLTNVLRHSGATRAAVTAGVRGDRLELVIADDGPSSCPDDGPRPGNGHRPDGGSSSDDEAAGGAGLAGMRERAAVLGGQVRAGRGNGGGFVVHAVLPTRLAP